MPSERADEALQRRLQDILSRPDLPAFSHHIQQILAYASGESASVRQVTEVVLREYSVSLRLLRAANSPLYNRSGRPILSVAHAASLMGMQAIRDVAAGMMLFEHFRKRSPGVRELMVLSLLSAHHAREAAERLGFPRPEEAYLCGMFRNLGEILIACYSPADYDRILIERKQAQMTEKVACRKVLQFQYEDLARRMVEHWGLPDSVKECQREFVPGMARLGPAHREFLHAVVSLGHSLTEAVYRTDGIPVPQGKLRAQRDAFASSLGVTVETLERVLHTSLQEAQETTRVLNIPLDTLRLKEQIQAAERGDTPGQEAIEEWTRRIRGGEYDLNELLRGVLETVQKLGPFDRALFALVDAATNTIQGRLGVGEDVDTLSRAFRFPLSLRGGPIALSIMRKQDLFRFGHNELTAFREELGALNFALCPVVVDGVVLGCLFCDRKNPAGLPSQSQKMLEGCRDVAAMAVKGKRG
ncbi:MAG: HDOD domain-containing protein [Bryobacterales bacterium]|nr:HDOD domain-containing protein [Bryobacterales bacterium]